MEYDTMRDTLAKPNEESDLDYIELWYEDREKMLAEAVRHIKHVLEDTGDNRPSELIEAVRLAYWLLNIASEGDDLPEYSCGERLNGIALGQVIMEHTNPDLGRGHSMTREEKRLWFDVAEHIGPDYAQGMYHAAVFVSKIA